MDESVEGIRILAKAGAAAEAPISGSTAISGTDDGRLDEAAGWGSNRAGAAYEAGHQLVERIVTREP
jgi:hypothetical protein